MRKKISIITTCFLLVAFCSFAQISSPIIFSRVTKKEGLASNTVFQSVRDKQGFLWIATQNGLQRYDRNRFLTFLHTPGNPSSLPQNSVNHLFIDSKERLWLLFDKQAGIFNTVSLRFSEVKIDSSIMQVRKIMEDGEGRIILFADGKPFIYDDVNHSFSAKYPLPALPAGYTITDMAIDPANGAYWFTGKQGSLVYDAKTKQLYSGEQRSTNSLLPDSIASIKNVRCPLIAKDGSWWLVSWLPFTGPPPVVYNYNKTTNKLSRFGKIRSYKAETYYEVWGSFQQSNGTVWIYGMGLLAYYNKTENRFIHLNSNPFQQNAIEYDYVTNLYEDKEKNVWLSTNRGLYRFNTDAQVFQTLSNKRPNDTTVAGNVVVSIIETAKQEIWVSTWGAGIFSYNSQLQPIPNPVTAADPANKGMYVGAALQRRNGEVWIGTHDGELKIFDPATNKTFSASLSLLKGERITNFLEDHTGNIWTGTGSGILVKCENADWKDTAHAYKQLLIEADDILKLYEDNNHHIWVCTASYGVYEMDSNGKVLKQYKQTANKNDGLLNSGATDIVQYNDSIYLFASDGLCILNKHTNTFSYLSPADGLPAEHITNLILDKQKRLWVTCDGALYRLNIDNKLFITYDDADGITSDIFQVGASILLKDGRIAMGTPHDFIVFDPEKTIDKKEVPAVSITGFVLGAERLSVDSLFKLDKLTLSYNNTYTRIELSTLSFRDSYYMYYMLDGLDKTWKRVYNNEITYPYLPPGDYTLKLKSENGEGTESKIITTLRIEVKPPFWQTWWFYAIILLLIGGLIFWLDNQRIKRKTAVLKMRSDIADNLHQDINAALSNITILSKMAKMKADKEPEKSKEFIDEIHTKSHNMTLAMDDMLWSIDPDNDSMEKFMLRFREHIAALKTQYNVQIDVLIDKKAEQLPLKMKMRNDVFWLFKGGITNTVRTGATNCRIHITYVKPHLIYTLEFDTSAMDLQQMNNLRLRSELFARLDELNATLDFKEYKTSAVFVLSIPVKGDGM
ncbi:MAG: two-component regulator propeller domain-containing protein [Chitinophagaceae bacterium]